jgi:hypothetical protein
MLALAVGLLSAGVGQAQSSRSPDAPQHERAITGHEERPDSTHSLLGAPRARATATLTEVCDSCEDDDGDGLIDCHDPDCWRRRGESPPPGCASNSLDRLDRHESPCDNEVTLELLWRRESSDLATPTVGDIDGDGVPEVIITVEGHTLSVLDGATGAVEVSRRFPPGDHPGLTTTIGDVDGDGFGEIFFGAAGETSHRLYRLSHDLDVDYAFRGGSTPNPLGAAALADFDHDGSPEVYSYGLILDAEDGDVLVDARAEIHETTTLHSLAVDLLPAESCSSCDGLELVTSHGVYAVDLSTGSHELVVPFLDRPNGTIAVADWNGDGLLDVVLNRAEVGAADLTIVDPRDGTAMLPPHDLLDHSTGVPTVGDFDGDGELEAALHIGWRRHWIRVVDNDMSLVDNFAQPENSSWTSATAFDFNCDNVPEVVHRGSEYLRIFSGLDGYALAEYPCRSGTAKERAVIADVNGDGQVDVLATCLWRGSWPMLHAFTVPGGPPARQVSNQYVDFTVQVNDDLSIPCRQQDHGAPGVHPLLRGFMNQSPMFDVGGHSCGDVCLGLANQPPICDAGPPQVVECEGETTKVSLDASGSFDPDPGDELSFEWSTDCPGVIESADAALAELTITSPPPCPVDCNVDLVVTDDSGAGSTCSTTVTIVDSTPPTLIVPEPVVLECNGPGGIEASDPQVQAWLASASATDACGNVTLSHDAPPFFPSGCPSGLPTEVRFVAVDSCGLVVEASSTLTVVDSTPPVVESRADDLACLWPPNHRYVEFTTADFAPTMEDLCESGPLTWRFEDCISDQADDGLGDGNTEDDCLISADGERVYLRSERSGLDPSGRRYALSYVAADACGNESEPASLGSIHVPHDSRSRSAPCRDASKLGLKADRPPPL